MNEKPADDRIVETLSRTQGQPGRAAELLGCPVGWIYRRARTSRLVQQTLRNFRAKLLDAAELAVWRAILDSQPWAVKLAFELWGRSRSFTDGGEVWHEPGHPGPAPSPTLVNRIADRIMYDNADFVEYLRVRQIESDSRPVCPSREPRRVADDPAPGGDRPCHHRYDRGANGADSAD